MHKVNGYAAHSAKESLVPFVFERREIGAKDVQIEILFCGVCHSDLYTARNEWQNTVYFEITEQTRKSVAEWIKASERK
jgi:uncharacterized zinc-type alcohol dehydrogenase-like protein